jgi:GDP-L-fucose synthase
MRVFIAGDRGMVGMALRRTLPRHYELILADRSVLDLRDEKNVANFLRNGKPDLIILAAARVGGISANSRYQRQFLLENLQIQNAVLNSAADLDIPNLIFLGSSCIYPRLAPQPITEDSLLSGPLEPTNEGYALAKIVGLKLCNAIHKDLGLNYFSLMPTNLYGPNDNFSLEDGHVPAALMRRFHEAKMTNQNSVKVWGSGNPKREFMHVDDLANACWFLAEKNLGGELINIGTGIDIEISEFAEKIAAIVGFQGEIEFDISKPDGSPRKLLDVSKVHGLGWQHKIQLEDGLLATYKWFVQSLEKGEVRGY